MATFDERFILPTQLPELQDNRLFNDFQVTPGTKIGNILTGNNGEERYQTWPEAMARSGYSLGQNFIEGLGKVPFETLNLPVGNPNDLSIPEYSGATQVVKPNALGELIGMEKSWNIPSRESLIGRTQDLAGLAGMSSIPLAEKGALGAIGGKFYSTLENTIAGSKVQKATPEQWTSYLKNQPGVKPEELEFSLQGLGDKPLTKEQLAQHVADNGIKFNEVVKHGGLDDIQISNMAHDNVVRDNPNINSMHPEYFTKIREEIKRLENEHPETSDTTKYSSYQLPGGDNYRELLMTTPTPMNEYNTFIKGLRDKYGEGGLNNKPLTEGERLRLDHLQEKAGDEGVKSYQSSHWDEPNVLAHIRMNDREVPGVGKTLHVEEIQSDWHQAGRKNGYRPENEKKFEDLIKKRDAFPEDSIEYRNTQNQINEMGRNNLGVPNAPFKKTWDELALKRVLSEAVEKGYDAVSWTPGEAQAARYDLSAHVDAIKAINKGDGTYDIVAQGKGGRGAAPDNLNRNVTKEKLADTVGKDLAEKIISQNEKERIYSGIDLKLGGEGMKAFYDTMLPAKANALIKKMGGKVEYQEIATPKGKPTQYADFDAWSKAPNETNQKIPIIKITPQMRETIANKGFPLYSSGVPTFTPVDDPFKKKYKFVPVSRNPFNE